MRVVLCYSGHMSQEFIAIIIVGVAIAGLILRMGSRLDNRIDELGKELRQDNKDQGERISGLIAEVAALKATVETFFRLRVDPPQPPEGEPRDHDKAA